MNLTQQTECLKDGVVWKNIKKINKVLVMSKEGKPLMPCSFSKSRSLVKSRKAKLIKTKGFFVIQLNFDCEEKIQDITLWIDTGFWNIGFSAVSAKEELVSWTVLLDWKTKDRLDEKRSNRKFKRSRLRYRQPRFLNRHKKDWWLPPSTQRRYNTHLILINILKKYLPIKKIIIEIAKFDIQKILNPDIFWIEYQQWTLYDYQNMRSYLLSRENWKCQFCKKQFKKWEASHIHHIKPRSKGWNNRHDNLAILHDDCHKTMHKKGIEKNLKSNSKDYNHSTLILHLLIEMNYDFLKPILMMLLLLLDENLKRDVIL